MLIKPDLTQLFFMLLIVSMFGFLKDMACLFRYRTLGDWLSAISSAAISLSSAWEVWKPSGLLFGSSIGTLLVSSSLWIFTALVFSISFLQNQVVQKVHNQQRLENKPWWQRIAFGMGFVGYGNHPSKIANVKATAESENTNTTRKQASFAWLGVGALFIMFGTLVGIAGYTDKGLNRASLFLITLGVVGLAGGCIDYYIYLQRRRKPSSREALQQLKCIQCGYDLRGLPEPRCPECGTAFTPEDNIAGVNQEHKDQQ